MPCQGGCKLWPEPVLLFICKFIDSLFCCTGEVGLLVVGFCFWWSIGFLFVCFVLHLFVCLFLLVFSFVLFFVVFRVFRGFFLIRFSCSVFFFNYYC